MPTPTNTRIRGAQINESIAGDGLVMSSGVMGVNVDDSSIEINSDTLRVKAGGITNDMLAGSIANAKLVNSSVTVTAGAGLSSTDEELSLGESATLSVNTASGISLNGDYVILDPNAAGTGLAYAAGVLSVNAGDGLGTSGDDLIVNVDGTTIQIIGDTLQATASGLDHGTLSGLGDDDHTIYVLADGTRDFTNIQNYNSHPSFSSDTDLVDKKYVDDATASGALDHGLLSGLGDNDHTQYATGVAGAPLTYASQTITFNYDTDDFQLNGNDLQVKDSGIDHGGLSGKDDDDHTQYILVDGTRGFTGTIAGQLPTETSHLTTKGYVDGLVQGLDWQESVISITTAYGDASASGTNRYVAPTTSGTWTEDYVYEWNGATWSGTAPDEGMSTWVEDEDILYVYNGSDWVKFGSTVTHNNTAGKQGGTAGEYYHLTASDYTDWVTNRNEVIQDIVGDMVDGGTETYISVDYSDGTGKLGFVVDTATTSGIGVASFNAGDFDVTAGDVTIKAGGVDNAQLANSSLTVTAGDGLQNGGSVSLGGSTTLNVDVSDFAGTGLEDDGSENLRIAASAAGAGLTGGAGSALSVLTASGIALNGDYVILDPSTAGDGLAYAAGVLSVNVDDSTIETNTDTLRVKDEGITEAKLNVANAPTDGYYLQYTTASGMQWTDVAVEGVSESDIQMEDESSSCDGVTTVFTLSNTPVANSVQVFLNGLLQQNGGGKDYTQSGTSITFTVAPITNDILVIHYVKSG